MPVQIGFIEAVLDSTKARAFLLEQKFQSMQVVAHDLSELPQTSRRQSGVHYVRQYVRLCLREL